MAAFFLSSSVGLRAASPDPVYAALRLARPQGDALAVKGLTLERDVFRFRFESGSFTFLAPVEGKSYGAVFVGHGSYELRPASEGERTHLALLAREKGLETLTDGFDSLVLLFTDSTAEEIRKAAGASSAPEPRAAEVFEKFLRRERKEWTTNFHLRLLEAARGSVGSAGAFLAFGDGRRFSPAAIIVDPAGVERELLAADLGGEQSALFLGDRERGGFWYLSREKSDLAAGRPAPSPPLRAEQYEIETEIDKSLRLRGTATIRVQPLAPGLRVLTFHLLPKLRLEEASIAPASGPATFVSAAFIQESEEEDADPAVVLPQPAGPSEPFLLRLRYSGKEVLHDAGEGNMYVGARTSWYPNFGVFRDPAPFRLTFRVPRGNDVVAVGALSEEKTEGDVKISVWKSEDPIRVAGFNYGKFKKIARDDPESRFHLEVLTYPGTPDIIHEINMALQQASSRRVNVIQQNPTSIEDIVDSPYASVPSYVGPQSVSVDTDSLAESAMVDGINSARVYNAYFGPLPHPHVSITEQSQWAFGQSWPSLVYLPFMAFLDKGVRHELGLTLANDFLEAVGPHEFAHQWWGHLVGWGGYRDQWLSEGLAEFSAALELEKSGGPRRADDFWEKARQAILEKPKGSEIANSEAGPITLGWRLSTPRSPYAYQAVVYSKGAYVIHMLRCMMRDAASPNPDGNFMALMKDFASSFAGKNPTTADFQKVVERHMVASMNATRDGKMDWFFKQWVDGTEIPRYTSKLEIKSEGKGKYRVTGTIAQEGVSPQFRALLPLYVDFGKGKLGRFGVLPLIGEVSRPVDVELTLPEKPKAVRVNALHDLLARS
jgi:hypothetical protein